MKKKKYIAPTTTIYGGTLHLSVLDTASYHFDNSDGNGEETGQYGDTSDEGFTIETNKRGSLADENWGSIW